MSVDGQADSERRQPGIRVPLYAEFDGKQVTRLGTVAVTGSQTGDEFKIHLPKKPRHVAVNLYHDVLVLNTVNQEKPAR